MWDVWADIVGYFRINMPVRNCTGIPEVQAEPRRGKDSEYFPRNKVDF